MADIFDTIFGTIFGTVFQYEIIVSNNSLFVWEYSTLESA